MTTKRVFMCTAGTCGLCRMRDQRDAGGPEARIGVGAREFPCGIRARTRRARSSNARRPSRTRGRASSPSRRRRPAAPVWSVRCQGVRSKRPAARSASGAPAAARPRAPRTPRRCRRAGARTRRGRGPCESSSVAASGRGAVMAAILVTDGKPSVCRSASPSAMAAAIATLSERNPAASGSAAARRRPACTASGTPADSRPNIRTSSGR